MPRYVTADALAGIPTLAGIPPEDHQQILDDAGQVLAYVTAHEWAPDTDARNHFEQLDWPPDRFNHATGVLRDTGRLLVFSDEHAEVLAPTSLTGDQAAA